MTAVAVNGLAVRRADRWRTRGVVPRRSWWSDPKMREALADHDLATVFRHLREHHQMSQRTIAAFTGQSQSEISEILAGRKVRSYDLLLRIAVGLAIPRGYMGLASTLPQRRA